MELTMVLMMLHSRDGENKDIWHDGSIDDIVHKHNTDPDAFS